MTNTPITTVEQFTELTVTVAEAIREAGEIPSGHLYAQLMGRLSLDLYNEMVATMKRAGLIEETNHVLKYTGTI